VLRIETITNSDTGKTITVRGIVYIASSVDAKGKEAASDD
jgi:DNA replicative helicase MCM subunit Mcm2 (Cdc46/Mcm family)